MTLVRHPDGSTHTIADPSVRIGRRIVTRLRLADGSSVPILLRPTNAAWMKAVTIDGEPVRHCYRGHVILSESTRIDCRGYQRCLICQRMKRRKAHAKWYAKNREAYNAKRRREYRQAKQQKGK